MQERRTMTKADIIENVYERVGGFSKKDAPEDLKYVAFDSWLLELGALPNFNMTCAGSPVRTLDDLP